MDGKLSLSLNLSASDFIFFDSMVKQKYVSASLIRSGQRCGN